jgi:hypothetical protein
METNARSASQSARGFAQRLKEDGRQTIEQRKRSAAERVEGIAQAIERTGAQFSENEPTLADLANRLAGTVGNFATRLREGSIDELLDDTRAFARRNPGLFIAGGVVAGFALARFVKASSQRTFDSAASADDISTGDAPTLTDELVAQSDAEAAVAEVAVAPPNPGTGSYGAGPTGQSSGV